MKDLVAKGKHAYLFKEKTKHSDIDVNVLTKKLESVRDSNI
mgnify:CR=1 FL=1|jgi:hypothetical protein